MPSPTGSLLFHIIIETPAAINFILSPSATLTSPQLPAHAIIRQYGLLLACTNAMVLFILCSQAEDSRNLLLERRIAGVLAIYHIGPLLRALARMRRGEEGKKWMTRPWLHVLVHGICLIWLGSGSMGL